MTTIRTDNAPLSGVWSRDLSASTPLGAEALAHGRGGQAFSACRAAMALQSDHRHHGPG